MDTEAQAVDDRIQSITDAVAKIKALVDAPAKAARESLADARATLQPIADWADAIRAKINTVKAEVKEPLDALCRVDFDSARVMLRQEDALLGHLGLAQRKVKEARDWLSSAERELSEIPQRIAALTIEDLTPVIIERRYGWGDRMQRGPFRIAATVWNYRSAGKQLRADVDAAAGAFAHVARRLSEDGVLLPVGVTAVPDQKTRPDDRTPWRGTHADMTFNVFSDPQDEQGDAQDEQDGAA